MAKTDPRRLISGFHFRGKLPHLKHEGAVYFVTFRLADSSPQEVMEQLKPEHEKESYDHRIRNDAERARLCTYVINNPVKARLCARPEDWLWSSANPTAARFRPQVSTRLEAAVIGNQG